MDRVAVYTANFSEYDTLYDPTTIDETVNYLCFTDCYFRSSAWQVMQVEQPCSTSARSSRYYFDQSCLVVPEYDVTLMHGANAQLTQSPRGIIARFLEDDTDIALFRHPHRNKVADEFCAVIALGKDTVENVEGQFDRYWAEGFEDDIGLSACIFLIRRQTPAVQEFERLWWNEVQNSSHRDQLSFDYVRWKTGIQVSWIPGDCFNSDFIRIRSHQ